MPQTPFISTACLMAALCVLPAQAADTPSNMPEPVAAATVGRPAAAPRAMPSALGNGTKRWACCRPSRPGWAATPTCTTCWGRPPQKNPPDLDKAFEHYRLALDIDPGHKGAHEYIGEAYLMRNQPAQARMHLATLQRLCGNTTCEEYQHLAKALAAYPE